MAWWNVARLFLSGAKSIQWTGPVLASLCLWTLSACYSGTAVKGTPVKEVSWAEKKGAVRSDSVETQKEAIAQLSLVKENDVFKTVQGIPEYKIGPLDVLEITSHQGDRSEKTEVKVDHTGKISYSFIDDLKVAGLTPSEADRLLTEKMSSYVRNPRIDVLVNEFKSKSAMALGELSSLRAASLGKGASGRIYLKGRTTLVDLIAMAGGYTIDADIRKIKVVKEGRAYLINLFDVLEKGDESLNVIIDDGDVVNVPELPEFGERVYVMGEVLSPGIYALKDAQDLLAAISLAGGHTRLAKEENTLIVRARSEGEKPLVMMADLKALFRQADIEQNIPLDNGDLVYVPRMRIADINDWIANTMPLLDLLLYPADFSEDYFKRQYLHFDRLHHQP